MAKSFKQMRTHTAAGIDIGTHDVKVVVVQSDPNNEKALPKIIGAAIVESQGLRHGYIVNIREAVQSVRQALALAERNSGTKIRKATISIGGIGLQSVTSLGSVVVSRGDSEVNELDLDKASASAERNLPSSTITNRKIIHTIPLSYRIDGKSVFGRPQGMKGNKLEAKVLFINSLSQHFEDLIDVISEAGIEVLDIVAAPVAASIVTLSKNQKVAGCVLVNIGSETSSMVLFENNLPISLEVFPIGSSDITNDIALGLKIPIEEAEALKRGATPGAHISKKKLDEIVEARLSDIFELIEAHLKKIDKNGLLPAGVIISGGGAGIPGIDELARSVLKLPARVISPKESALSIAYGLATLGLGTETHEGVVSRTGVSIGKKIVSWFKQFLP